MQPLVLPISDKVAKLLAKSIKRSCEEIRLQPTVCTLLKTNSFKDFFKDLSKLSKLLMSEPLVAVSVIR